MWIYHFLFSYVYICTIDVIVLSAGREDDSQRLLCKFHTDEQNNENAKRENKVEFETRRKNYC